MLELFIEDHLLDPSQAGVSREEQRRRILFELEAPVVPSDQPESSVRPSRAQSRAQQLQRRMDAVRKQMASEKDPAKRLALKDQLIVIGKQIREEQEAQASA